MVIIGDCVIIYLLHVKAFIVKFMYDYCSFVISSFQVNDAFVGYREDTAAVVVFQANHELKNFKGKRFRNTKIFTPHLSQILLQSSREFEIPSEVWTKAVRTRKCKQCTHTTQITII